MITFAEARAFLLKHRTDYDAAVAGFRWPSPVAFNWALDWFDAELAGSPAHHDRTALWLVDAAADQDTTVSFAALSQRSNQVANYLRALGLRRGDHVLLLLGNVVELWESMLAAIKLGAVIVPATTLLTADELADRIARADVRFVVAGQDQTTKFAQLGDEGPARVLVEGGGVPGWHRYADSQSCSSTFVPDADTGPDDPMLLYFTSGTTAKPKLVRHSHRSYPVGSLSTMYWIGLQPGDLHLNISSPGWAKHAWSSVFAPWNAGATVCVVNQPRFEAKFLLRTLERVPVTTLCAPPTVFRLLIQEDLAAYRPSLREVCGAGEPLNPEVIERVRDAWGLTIRDGYGQTETTAQVANSPGQPVRTGGMGRPMPGYRVRLLDADGNEANEGELCLALDGERPAGLMQGYVAADGSLGGFDAAVYRTGDVATRDAGGYFTFVGRADDVFKSSDYRISPFELESVLIEHPAIAEAAVVASPDPIRLAVPKAFVTLVAGVAPSRETAVSIFLHARERLSPFKRVRLIEFVPELPKTISGKIRRSHLRRQEYEDGTVGATERARFAEADLFRSQGSDMMPKPYGEAPP